MVPVRQGDGGHDPWLVRDFESDTLISGKTGDIVTTAVTEVIPAQTGGARIYVTQLLVMNSHATVSTWVNIKDGSGSVLQTIYAAAVGGGASLVFPKPLRCDPNASLTATCETSGANVRVSASGFRGT